MILAINKGYCWQVAYALELGYRLIDTPSDYGTQLGIGQGIKESGVDRKNLFKVTKSEETDDAYERTKSNLEELTWIMSI